MRVVRVLAAAVTMVVGVSAPSGAAVINLTGNYSNASVTIPLTLLADGIVDFQTATAILGDDPTISLFDAGGNHIVTVDDEYTLLPPPDGMVFFSLQAHLTRNLAAGDYFVLVTEFPIAIFPVATGGASTPDTDGFNYGTFWFDGSATLADVQAAAAAAGAYNEIYRERPYNVTITADVEAAPVPEPTSMLLVGSGLALAQIRRARRRKN